jgi:hypothetical protein
MSLPTNIPWSQAEIDTLLLLASKCTRYGREKTYGAVAAELNRQLGTNPQMQPRRGRLEGEAEFNGGMVCNQLERLEKRNPDLMPKRVQSRWKRNGPTQRVASNAQNRDELEAEGFIVSTAKEPQTKEEIKWHHEELQLLSQLALNTKSINTISIAKSMNAYVTSKNLPIVRECEYTEQMIRDAYRYLIDRGWKPPTLTEKKAIKKGSNRSAGRRQSGKSRPVNEPSMAGSSESHVQQQKLPTFEPPSQATIAVSRPPGNYSQQAKLPGSSSVIGAHVHRGPPQHTNQRVPTIEPPSQEATLAASGAPGPPEFSSAIAPHGHQIPSHPTNLQVPTIEPQSHRATMAISGAPGGHSQRARPLRVDEMLNNDAKHQIPPQNSSLPGIGGILGSHGHRGASQQVNAPAMMGTSSTQHLHPDAQHASRGFPPPTSSHRPFHPLNDHDHHDHHGERGPDLRPITEPMGRCTLDSEPGGSHGQSHQHSGKGKIPALEPQLGGN